MIGHLIYMAALGAPEIGSALTGYIAKAVVDAVAEEAKRRVSGGLADLGGTFASLGADMLGGMVTKTEELSPELQQRIGTILAGALKEFDLTLIKTEDLAALRRAAEQPWQPISSYDDLPKKPTQAAFRFAPVAPERAGGFALPATVELTRRYGQRTCTHWLALPDTDGL